MGACISKDAEAGIKKFNQKKSKKSKNQNNNLAKISSVPDGTSAENTKDLFAYQREQEKPSCSTSVNWSSPSEPCRSSEGRTFYEGPSKPLKKYDRVVWIDEDNFPEKGTFKWIGILDGERCVGIELDSKRTVSFGAHTGRKLFGCKPGHRAVVPLYQVMLVKDFEERLRVASTPKEQSKTQFAQPSSSNRPKRKMKDSVDRFYSGGQKDSSLKKTKVEGDTSTSQQPSSSLQSSTITDTCPSTSAMATSTPKKVHEIPDISADPPIPRKRRGQDAVLKDPNWNPGDKIKFRGSKEEAEILETKLEDDELVAKIQYTTESTRPGQIVVSPLVDVMMESNLVERIGVEPPLLHQSLRRNSFLEAIIPTDNNDEMSTTSSRRSTLKKDEAIQTSMTDLDEIMSPPSFYPYLPSAPAETGRSVDAQTSFEYPLTSTKFTFVNSRASSNPVPFQFRKSPAKDVVDYTFIQPWPGSTNAEKDEFGYPLRWTESFRKSQREAARIGALKMQELKRKSDRSKSSDELDDSRDSHNISSDEVQKELERVHVQSPMKVLDDLNQRPLESPTLVKMLARRNTYPLVNSSQIPSSVHSFSKEKLEFFGINQNPNDENEKAKIVDVKRKVKPSYAKVAATSTKPSNVEVASTSVRVKPSYAELTATTAFSKQKTTEDRPKSGPPEQYFFGTDPTKTSYFSNINGKTSNEVGQSSSVRAPVEVHREESGKRTRDTAYAVDSLSRPSSRKRRKLCRPGLQKNAMNVYPPFSSDDIHLGIGSQRGIGGMRNSCYLDTTLFSLFYCTDIFDATILFNNTEDDVAKLITKYLHNIVFHLRGGGFCEGERIMKLRNAMKSDKVKGQFMDAEEFMFNLFEQTLKLPEFIHYYPDTKDYMTQIFIDNTDPRKCTTVQELLETSFKLQEDMKLVSIPFPAWIIEMPRSNGRLVHYDAIIPTVHLKMNDILMKVLNDGTISCFCQIGKPPFWACQICHDENDHQNENLTFCSNCKESLIESLHDEMNHSPEPVLYDPSTNSLITGNETTSSIDNELTMDLLAVICFKASHYTCFVKCGTGKDSTWIYFDSMTGTSSMVEEVTEMKFWLNELEKDPKLYKNKNVPSRVKQILFDSHIYIYAPPPSMCPKSTSV